MFTTLTLTASTAKFIVFMANLTHVPYPTVLTIPDIIPAVPELIVASHYPLEELRYYESQNHAASHFRYLLPPFVGPLQTRVLINQYLLLFL
jgi:hypothetical protein